MQAVTQGNDPTGLVRKIANYCWWKSIKKIDTTKDNIIDTIDNSRVCGLMRTTSNGLKEIKTLFKVLGNNPSKVFWGEYSELNRKYYESNASYIITLMKVSLDLSPQMKESEIKRLDTQNCNKNGKDPTPNEKWLFINGVSTSEDMAELNALMLSKVFGRPITPLHNPTNGMIPDLIEAIIGRDFDKYTNIARTAKQLIWEELESLGSKLNQSHKVVVIVHSQGGIIISNVVGRLLEEHPEDPLLDHLEVYTFASAHDEYPSFGIDKKPLNYQTPFTEHFANDEDFVARLGVLHEDSTTEGDVYEKKGAGHLLNYHYLIDFLAGKYDDQGQSRLSCLRNGKR